MINTATYPTLASQPPAQQPNTRDAAVNRAFPCAACKGAGSCSVCMTLYTESTYEDRDR
jgi:hypothetical protein